MPVRTDPSQEVAVFRLNEVGALLWELLEAPATAEDLGRQLVARYEVSLEQAQADVAGFVNLLASKGLIEPAER